MNSNMKQLLKQSYKGDEIIEYIEELERELDIADNLVGKYNNALNKACEELENLSYVKGIGQIGKNFKEWKGWCLKDDFR